VALSRLKHGFESRWGRHFILRAPNCGQVLERVGRYGGSDKLFSVERYTITEEQRTINQATTSRRCGLRSR
jgi:sarcosine oxidase delta subunit